ncbi:MAG: NADH-quinone oxidoreductase subunit K [Anaerolineales bacterium]|nr:NADH-quinone oxidoreductase subunit K [Anaerolineales bacterium]
MSLIQFLNPFEIILILTTLLISTANSVQRSITHYRRQSGLLAAISGISVFLAWIENPWSIETLILVVFVMILPILLAAYIEPILVRATVASQGGLRIDAPERQAAQRIWQRNEGATASKAQELLVLAGLVVLAVLVAFRLDAAHFDQLRIGLVVSLTLHLVGLYNMVIKRDIISQVIGLLIMDHGLYLAVVKVVAVPYPAMLFVLGLFFYTLITVAILVFMLPMVRRQTGSINLDEIAHDSTLEG